MDLFELLKRNVEKKDLNKEDDKEKERHRRKKPDRAWSNWLPGFLIYARVVVNHGRCNPFFNIGFDL